MILRDLGPKLSTQLRNLYAGLGIEMPVRELEETIEEEMVEVFKLHVRRETAKVLGVPVNDEAEADGDA